MGICEVSICNMLAVSSHCSYLFAITELSPPTDVFPGVGTLVLGGIKLQPGGTLAIVPHPRGLGGAYEAQRRTSGQQSRTDGEA